MYHGRLKIWECFYKNTSYIAIMFFLQVSCRQQFKNKTKFLSNMSFFIEGAMCLSLLVVTVMPVIAGRAHNPFLSFSLLLATMMLLYRLWALLSLTLRSLRFTCSLMLSILSSILNRLVVPILRLILSRIACKSYLCSIFHLLISEIKIWIWFKPESVLYVL